MEHAPQLVISDIDGTLLNSQDRVIPRLREVITRAVRSGAEVALATGRPHRWIYPVLEQLPVRPVCVTANGAVLYDSGEDKVLRAHELAPETMSDVVAAARGALAAHGGVAVACERVGTSAFDPEDETFVISPGYVHTWAEQGFGVFTEEEVVSEPAVKMILRNDNLTAPQMYGLIAPHVDESKAHVTFSMNEGLIEIAAPGVTKALGVSTLAELHGVEQSRTVAFGDMPNDIEMLRWVGFGVAMGNARDEVKAAADHITGTNDEGGVAQVLERWF